METVLKIRRMHQVDGQSINAIAKVTGLSRNTVRKYLRQPLSEPPKYHRPQPARPKLGEFEPTLTQWLDLDAKRPTLTALYSSRQERFRMVASVIERLRPIDI